MTNEGEYLPNASKEDEFVIQIEINEGEVLELERGRAGVVRYLGELAIYDYIRLPVAEDDEDTLNFERRLFKQQIPDDFEYIVELMEQNGYDVDKDIADLRPHIQDSFDRALCGDIAQLDSFPDSWESN